MSPLDAVRRQRVLGIVRAADGEAAEAAARGLFDAGLEAVEISLTTTDALAAIARLSGEGRGVGAGTVIDEQSAAAALDAGARFLVSPVLSEGATTVGRRRGAGVVVAAATPSEALRALEVGADLIKLFPARLWSPAAMADLLQALPQLPLMPTGGVSVETAAGWIQSGAVAVGMGGSLTPERVPGLLKAVRA